MNFEVKITGNEVWTLRAAGVEMAAYQELFHEVISKRAKLPAVVNCPYFLSDDPVNVRINVLAFGHFQIEVADAKIGKDMHAEILRFARESRATAVDDKEHKELYARVNQILKPDGLTAQKLESTRATLTRRAQIELMQLCEEVHYIRRDSLYWQFVNGTISKADREFLARWLLKRFALEKDPTVRRSISTVFLNHTDLAIRAIADELIRLIRDPRYGSSRSGLVDALARTKYPDTAAVIASVIDQKHMAWSVLTTLGKLKASQYAALAKKYLRHPDSEVRLQAKRALKKMGCPMETAPPPVHLVKNRKSLPKGLEEWSANLDFDQLDSVLKTLTQCVDRGFGAEEMAEVIGVAEETRPEQTKAFRFPITANGQSSELWLVVFMDDIDAPDLQIHGRPELIRKFESAVDLKD